METFETVIQFVKGSGGDLAGSGLATTGDFFSFGLILILLGAFMLSACAVKWIIQKKSLTFVGSSALSGSICKHFSSNDIDRTKIGGKTNSIIMTFLSVLSVLLIIFGAVSLTSAKAGADQGLSGVDKIEAAVNMDTGEVSFSEG